MKKLTLLFCLFIVFFSSCSKEQGQLLIRVVNQTDKTLTDVSVFSLKSDGITDVEKKYGSVSPGSATDYRSHQLAISFPLCKFTIEGYGTTELREARCGAGMVELSSGKYTILVQGEANAPLISLRED